MELITKLKPFIQEAWKKADFEQPTSIQEMAIPKIIEGKDLICESPTGTGKTLAYLLPILENIDTDVKEIQAVILSPTRELAMQIHQVIQNFTMNSGIVSGAFIGGVDLKRQIDRLKKNPMVVVGTPGRINELLDKKKMKMHKVKTVVVDEVDQMIAQRLTFDVKMVIQSTLKERQVLFFSATISEVVQDFAKKVMVNAEFIRVEREKNKTVEHIYFVSDRRDKIEVLRRIYRLDESMKALIFINDSFHIDELAAKFKYKKIPIGILHSAANKKERAGAIQKFRSGKLSLLLATDIAARGMDIEGLTHVIHLDMPEKIEQYIHRSGRTGRMGAAGTVISLVTPQEEKQLLKYGKGLGLAIQRKDLYGGAIVDELPKEKVPHSNSTRNKPFKKQAETGTEARTGTAGKNRPDNRKTKDNIGNSSRKETEGTNVKRASFRSANRSEHKKGGKR